MKQPYYMIDFSASACFFEIRVNDTPVLSMNIKGQAATKIPINYAIFKSGKQEVSITMLPLLGSVQLQEESELYYNVQLFDINDDFKFKEEFNGFRSKKIDSKKIIPTIKNISFFNAEIPYQLNELWKEGEDIKGIDDFEKKIRGAYLYLGNYIREGNYAFFKKAMAKREKNMATSMYLSSKESETRLNRLVYDFENGFTNMVIEKSAIVVHSAYGKKASLKKTNGESAFSFINDETKEELMLDIEFYYNKEANAFEII